MIGGDWNVADSYCVGLEIIDASKRLSIERLEDILPGELISATGVVDYSSLRAKHLEGTYALFLCDYPVLPNICGQLRKSGYTGRMILWDSRAVPSMNKNDADVVIEALSPQSGIGEIYGLLTK